MNGAEAIATSQASAAAAAEAKRRRNYEEEEEVTPMSTDPSSAVEYKIIRSAIGAFKNPTTFREALVEEAYAGWELIENLDDSRARLRRSIKWRERDGELAQDPYRIRIGMSESAILVWAILGTIGAIGLVVAVLVLIGK